MIDCTGNGVNVLISTNKGVFVLWHEIVSMQEIGRGEPDTCQD